jgi:hypothetical protein
MILPVQFDSDQKYIVYQGHRYNLSNALYIGDKAYIPLDFARTLIVTNTEDPLYVDAIIDTIS